MEVTFSQAKIPPAPIRKSNAPAAAAPAATPPAATPPAAVPAGQPPAAAAAPGPKIHIPSAEELKQQTAELYASQGWGKPPEEAAAPAGATPPAEPTAAQPAAAPAAAAPEEIEPAPVEEELTPREMIQESARETGRAVADALRENRAPEAAAAPAGEPELSEADAADHVIMAYMEQTNPGKYPGLSQKWRDYCKAHYAYQTKWLDENPDKEFNPDDHQDWYDKNQPEIDPKAMEEARVQMLVEKKYEEKVAPERRAAKAQEAFSRELPAIAGRIQGKIHAMVCQMNPELGKLITGPNGEHNINLDTIAAIESQDPIAKDIADRIVAEELEPMTLELEKIGIEDMGYQFDPKNNPIHARIGQFLAKQEREMAAAPRAVQVRNGQQWLTLADYNTRLNGIRRSSESAAEKEARVSDLNRNYWTLTVDMAQDLIVDYCAKKAAKEIAAVDNLARKKYVRTEIPAGGTPAAAPAGVQTPPMRTAAGKPISPALGGQSAVVTTGAPGAPPQKSYAEAAVDVNFSR